MKDFWNDEFALQYFYSFFDLIEPGFTNLNTTYMLVKKDSDEGLSFLV